MPASEEEKSHAVVDSSAQWAQVVSEEKSIRSALDSADAIRVGALSTQVREHVLRLVGTRSEEAADQAGLAEVSERVRGLTLRLTRESASGDTGLARSTFGELLQSLGDVERQYPAGVPPLR